MNEIRAYIAGIEYKVGLRDYVFRWSVTSGEWIRSTMPVGKIESAIKDLERQKEDKKKEKLK